jgi:hypothetical protein
MTYSTVKLCSSRGAYEAAPQPRLELDLGSIRDRLVAEGVPVVDCRVMLLLRMGCEVTLGRDGRILLKTRDAEEASRVFEELCRRLDLPREPSSVKG